MSSQWLGCVVSINCGPSLGHYQGQVTCIDVDDQTVTIIQPYHNGKKSLKDSVTISSSTIVDLQIIRSKEEADDIVNIPAVPQVLSEQTKKAVLPKCPSPVKIIHSVSAPTIGFAADKGRSGYCKQPYGENFDAHSSPIKTRSEGVGRGANGRQADGNVQSPDKEFRLRKNSDTGGKRPSSQQRRGTTPKKMDGRKNNQPYVQVAFSLPTECIMGGGDFDFEMSNSMFDKQAEFEKIENGFDYERPTDRRPSKYRHDENVLSSQPTELRQIRVPGCGQMDYVTDTGLVVPTISVDLRGRLLEAAEQFGFTTDRVIEHFSRSASEMAMQLLGGSCRWVPGNDHQRPTVVVLCGPHLQGAFGASCARHLSNHGAKVVVFSPTFKRMNPALETELRLLELSSATQISSVKDLPKSPVDLVINALENHEHGHLRGQTWFMGAVTWSQGQLARCLALDPPREGLAIPATWSLGLVLPLALPSSCGQQYLCDVGLSPRVFSRHNIEYTSPFAHKFFVSLTRPINGAS